MAAVLDLGPSFKYPGQTVNEIIAESVPVSAQLGLISLVLALGTGVTAGLLAAWRKNTWMDYALMLGATLGVSVPSFILAAVLIQLFAFTWPVLPAAMWKGPAYAVLPALALAALLYARLFGWTDWGSLALPALVILAPPLVFALGSGWLLGRLRPWLLYVWMLLPFALAALPLPEALGLWNGGLCTSYPLTLGMLDPAFSLPAAAWAVQGLLLAAGVLLLLVAGKGKKVYNQ